MAHKVLTFLNPRKLARKRKKEYDTLAYIFIALSFVITLPQVFEIYNNQSAQDISLITWAGYTALAFFWLVYGVERGVHPIIFSSLMHLVVDVAIVYGIILYEGVNLGF